MPHRRVRRPGAMERYGNGGTLDRALRSDPAAALRGTASITSACPAHIRGITYRSQAPDMDTGVHKPRPTAAPDRGDAPGYTYTYTYTATRSSISVISLASAAREVRSSLR